MSELEEALKKVEEMRKHLNDLVAKKDITDPEVLRASKMVDAVLNEYQKLLEEKKGNIKDR